MYKYMLSFLFLIISIVHVNGQSQSNAVINSPEILEDKSVIFRLKAPDAKSVKLAGTMISDYSEWDMQKNSSGIFEVQIGPLVPDMYVYTFLVDSIRIIDPNNKIVVRDGSHIESRLMIPGGKTELYDVKDVPHGRLTSLWYPAPTLEMTRRCIIYTPPGYENSTESYPVLYLLHGGGGDEEAWVSRGRVNYIMDNLIAQKKATPMIIVIPNGNPSATSAPGETALSRMSSPPSQAFEMLGELIPRSLVNDLIPFVEKNYRVKSNHENRAVAGLSMGGYQTQKVTNKYPDTFNYIGVMSMGLYNTFEPNYDEKTHIEQLKQLSEQNPELYWIACGKDDFLYEGLVKLLSFYDEQGFKYTYRESEGGHSWNNWRMYLSEIATMIFQN